MDIQHIVTAILTGDFSSDEINRIIRAINSRRDMEKHRAIAINRNTFEEGDRVVFTGLKKGNGVKATILGINRVKAVVRVESNTYSKFASKIVTVPLNCLKKIN